MNRTLRFLIENVKYLIPHKLVSLVSMSYSLHLNGIRDLLVFHEKHYLEKNSQLPYLLCQMFGNNNSFLLLVFIW